MTVWVRRFGWATLVANIGIIVTGGLVRLTGSGLGCPTWPRCTSSGFTPHGALDVHSAIEFGNRTLTFLLVAIAVGTFVTARGTGRADLTRLSVILALLIPAQAVLGGITVLTNLNPWVVSLHMVPSLGIVCLAVLYVHRIDHPSPVVAHGPTVRLAWLVFAVAWVVFYVGTIVTGAGPHAGDADAPRNGLDTLEMSQLHADLVFLLVGLSVGLYYVLRSTGASAGALNAAHAVLGVEVAQGTLGFVQYFTDLPVLVVALHMLGTGLTAASVTWLVLQVREGRPTAVDAPSEPAYSD
jgi:heme a synthase